LGGFLLASNTTILEGVAEGKAWGSQQNKRVGDDDAFSDGLAAVGAMLDDNICTGPGSVYAVCSEVRKLLIAD
jgi:hypothetical protein